MHAPLHVASTGSIPTWSDTVSDGGAPYTYSMVGNNPQVTLGKNALTTTISVPVIPLIIKINTSNGTAIFDPTTTSTCDGNAQSVIDLAKQSPVFQNSHYVWGVQDIGTTQYVDAFQRANFWKFTRPTGINPNYHVLLKYIKEAPVTVNVPAASGTTFGIGCELTGEFDLHWFDDGTKNTQLQGSIFPTLSHSVNPKTFPVFLMKNVVAYDGSLSKCCILGYHWVTSDIPAQTYSVADWDLTTNFRGPSDVKALSHEVAEWVDDPFATNPTPAWGYIGQVSTGCQANLEVGDQLSGGNHEVPVTLNGFTYHPQELAFRDWFYHLNSSSGPPPVSLAGANGWYSNNGTLRYPSRPCPPPPPSIGVFDFTSNSPTDGGVGDLLEVFGSNFLPLDSLEVEFDGLKVSTTPSAVMTDSNGGFGGGVNPHVSFTIPVTQGGDHTVTVIGQSGAPAAEVSFGTATAHFSVGGRITLSSTRACPGSNTVQGTGFGGGETVDLSYSASSGSGALGSAATDSLGSFSQGVTLPGEPNNSYIIVHARGETSGETADATFLVNCLNV